MIDTHARMYGVHRVHAGRMHGDREAQHTKSEVVYPPIHPHLLPQLYACPKHLTNCTKMSKLSIDYTHPFILIYFPQLYVLRVFRIKQ